MEGYPERFYTRFEVLLGWFALVGGPIWAIAIVAPTHRHWDAQLVLEVVALLAALCIVCAAAVVAAFPVRIGRAGIRSYDMWGRYSSVPWNDIKRVEPRNYVGFPFLRIVSVSGRVVYVTTWIRNPDIFLNRVGELAGAENPLTRALEGGRGRS
jgi:hypothetical protein